MYQKIQDGHQRTFSFLCKSITHTGKANFPAFAFFSPATWLLFVLPRFDISMAFSKQHFPSIVTDAASRHCSVTSIHVCTKLPLEADNHSLWHSIKGNVILFFFFLSKCKLTALKKKKIGEEYLVLISNSYLQQSWISLVVSVISLLTTVSRTTPYENRRQLLLLEIRPPTYSDPSYAFI